MTAPTCTRQFCVLLTVQSASSAKAVVELVNHREGYLITTALVLLGDQPAGFLCNSQRHAASSRGETLPKLGVVVLTGPMLMAGTDSGDTSARPFHSLTMTVNSPVPAPVISKVTVQRARRYWP